jgi:hypothetical protein
MNPTLEQLARYVVQELERGVPEVTLYAALRESGWTQDWISAAFSTAKQRAMPERGGQMSIPSVSVPQQPVAARPSTNQPQSATPAFPRQRPMVTPVRPTATRSTVGLKKVLLIVIAVLSVIVIGLGIYRTVIGLHHQAGQRVVRDANRREDLSVLLSNLSDYFVTHKSYPTRTQLNTPSFLKENGFSVDSITDPKWTPKEEACTKDGQAILAGTLVPSCYAYEVKTSQGGVCNNGTTPCTKVKVTIWLEADKQPYSVTFDKNTQTDQ